jgi:hypothetical protein
VAATARAHSDRTHGPSAVKATAVAVGIGSRLSAFTNGAGGPINRSTGRTCPTLTAVASRVVPGLVAGRIIVAAAATSAPRNAIGATDAGGVPTSRSHAQGIVRSARTGAAITASVVGSAPGASARTPAGNGAGGRRAADLQSPYTCCGVQGTIATSQVSVLRSCRGVRCMILTVAVCSGP